MRTASFRVLKRSKLDRNDRDFSGDLISSKKLAVSTDNGLEHEYQKQSFLLSKKNGNVYRRTKLDNQKRMKRGRS
jgi:hypothetical protein